MSKRTPSSLSWIPTLLCCLLASVSLLWPLVAGAQAPGQDLQQAPAPQLTRPPSVLQFVEAEYPQSEKAEGRAASVVLDVAISATGTVDDARVVNSAGPAFDEAALQAVRQFLFTPAEIDHQPAPVRIQYRYDFVLKPEVIEHATFAGVVRQRGSGQPLPGVNVVFGERQAVTGADGRFSFDQVPPGTYQVTLSRADLEPQRTEETLAVGQALEATYEIELPPPAAEQPEETDDLEIVVTAPKLVKQAVSTAVVADEAKRVAGTQGDVLKVVQNLPGVTRSATGSGAIVVWGAAPEDTRTYVDGVRVPILYHFGGLRSVVHNEIVGSVELIPGGYGPAYGRGLGGLVTVQRRAPSAERLKGSLQADLLDASAALSGPLSSKLGFQVAARRSHADDSLRALSDEDPGEFFPIPEYHDAQGSLRYQLSSGAWLELGGLVSSDETSRRVASADPSQRKSETRELAFQRIFARYEFQPGDGSEITLTPWFGSDQSSRVNRFGGTPTSLSLRTLSYGARATWRGPIAPFLDAAVGLDLELSSAAAERAGSVTSPPREGDPQLFGVAPSDQVNVDDWTAAVGSAAPYAEADFNFLENRLHILPGLRFEPFFTSVGRRVPREGDEPSVGAYRADIGLSSIQPRLSLRYSPREQLTFTLAGGRYRQPPLVDDLSAVFGNPLLDPASAWHALASTSVKLTELLGVEATAFYSRSDDLAVRNPADSPLIAEALVQGGEGRSYGLQLLARRELADGLFGWFAYTLLRSERRGGADEDWRLFDFDQTHILTALASYDLGAGFDLGARVRYATGFPRTPVAGAFYDSRRDSFEPILGPKNGTRIPAFFQLDVRVSKRWKLGTSELEAYLDVQNVTDRNNHEEILYASDFSERRYIDGLPILPVFGLSWQF